jgi:type VI secretion system secreted protein Hcp
MAAYNLSQMEIIDESAKNIAYTQYEEPSDIFLKIEKVEGSSEHEAHKGEIEILAYFWGETQDVDLSAGTQVGKVKMDDLKLVFLVDPKASPMLMHACASGQSIPDAILTVFRHASEGSTVELLKITLQNVVVSSYVTSYEPTQQYALPVDEMTLAYQKITFDYFEIEPDGSKGQMTGFYWDLATNQGGAR